MCCTDPSLNPSLNRTAFRPYKLDSTEPRGLLRLLGDHSRCSRISQYLSQRIFPSLRQATRLVASLIQTRRETRRPSLRRLSRRSARVLSESCARTVVSWRANEPRCRPKRTANTRARLTRLPQVFRKSVMRRSALSGQKSARNSAISSRAEAVAASEWKGRLLLYALRLVHKKLEDGRLDCGKSEDLYHLQWKQRSALVWCACVSAEGVLLACLRFSRFARLFPRAFLDDMDHHLQL